MGACELPGRAGQIRTGTYAGYRAHQRAHEPACQPCAEAKAKYGAAHYVQNKAIYNEHARRNYAENREAEREKRRAYYAENRAACAARMRAWRDENRNIYREMKKRAEAKRRQQRAATQVEPIDLSIVAERDGWSCRWCGEPVCEAFAYPDPMSASLDHVIPLAFGGEHTYDNVQLLHWICNVLKGTRIEKGA